MITGLIVSMTSIITLVLTALGDYLDGIDMGSAMGIADFASAFNMEANTSPEVFQLIVGVYLIEVVIILGIFLTRIGEGENKITQWYTVGKMLAVAVIIYFLVAVVANENRNAKRPVDEITAAIESTLLFPVVRGEDICR